MIDWGDGNIITYDLSVETVHYHTYAETNKQYLIKIAVPYIANLLKFNFGASDVEYGLLIVKFGADIPDSCTNFGNGGSGYNSINFVKLPDNMQTLSSSNLRGCSCLHKAILPPNVTVIPTYFFNSLYALQNINLDNIISIGDSNFNACAIKTVNAPLCTNIGAFCFQNCCNLDSIVVSNACTFGTNTFLNCFMLYPKPF